MIITAIAVFAGCVIGWNTRQPTALTNLRQRYLPTNRRL